MKNKFDLLNLAWGLIWFLVLGLAVLGYFWRPATLIVALIGGAFCVMFFHDFFKYRGL